VDDGSWWVEPVMGCGAAYPLRVASFFVTPFLSSCLAHCGAAYAQPPAPPCRSVGSYYMWKVDVPRTNSGSSKKKKKGK